jgi:hypothetical protein
VKAPKENILSHNYSWAEIRPLSSCCGDDVKDDRNGDAICLDCKEACHPVRPRDFGFKVWPKEDDE